MELLVVLAIFVTLTIFSLAGWRVVDSRDGQDWKPMDWPTARR